MTLGDAMVVDSGVFFRVNTVPLRAYLAEIAELKMNVDRLDARESEAQTTISDLRDDLERAAEALAKKDEAIAVLTGALERCRAELAEAHSTVVVPTEELKASDPAAVGECESSRVTNTPAEDCDGEQYGTYGAAAVFASITPSERKLFRRAFRRKAQTLRQPLRWTKRVVARLRAYVAMDIPANKIATFLSCEFKRKVTSATVKEKMRALWQWDDEGYYVSVF